MLLRSGRYGCPTMTVAGVSRKRPESGETVVIPEELPALGPMKPCDGMCLGTTPDTPDVAAVADDTPGAYCIPHEMGVVMARVVRLVKRSALGSQAVPLIVSQE